MLGGPYVTYSEITGCIPSEAEIEKLLQPLDARKVLFLLSRMNMHFRLASASEETTFERAVGKAQEFLFQNFTDEDLFEQIKEALKITKTHERALFHPLQMLNVMRLALKYCQGVDASDHVTEDQRYTVGRCCLMMNDLLSSVEDQRKLFTGSSNTQKAELMTQLLPAFEVNNPGNLSHLLQRSLGTFNFLFSDAGTKSDVLARSGGYDIVQRFQDLTGISLERWVALLFCCIAYYNQYGGEDGSDQDYKYLWIDPRVFRGPSKISEADLDTILTLIAKPIEDFTAVFAQPSVLRQSIDITASKFHPLVKIGFLYICSDFGFLTEKLFAGAYWAIHDREGHKGRTQLAIAWGILFERYVNWWGQGRTFHKAMTFYPFPVWDSRQSAKRKRRQGPEEEAFDAVILHDGRFVALEYKGGFLSLEAKYSLNKRFLLRDLNKKIAKGCRQLARNIGELYAIVPGRKLKEIPTEHVTRVIPMIVVQDQALRSLGINWWINRQFQRAMRRAVLRPEVTVEPVTLIHISEFETMIDSAEGPDFDLVAALQLRNFRDPESMSELTDLLLQSRGYGSQYSSRRKELDEEFKRSVLKYAFDLDDVTQTQ
jgi:hypothetical protein